MLSIPNTAPESSSILKRAYSILRAAENTGDIPDLPPISGDVLLQVYTHKSLRRTSGKTSEGFGDNERYSMLGTQVLETALTHILFFRKPLLDSTKITARRTEIMSDDNMVNWVATYGMTGKLRCHPQLVSSLDSPEEARLLFNAYVGGVFEEHGLDVVIDWVKQLVEPSGHTAPGTPPAKKVKSEWVSPARPPARQAPPHLPPPNPTPPNPLSPAQPNLPFLPMFNQAAAQRKVAVEYRADFSGPSHAGRWSVECVVSGIVKGTGTGGSKQAAKEAAARAAFAAMGWAPRG